MLQSLLREKNFGAKFEISIRPVSLEDAGDTGNAAQRREENRYYFKVSAHIVTQGSTAQVQLLLACVTQALKPIFAPCSTGSLVLATR